jgi:hypothetical protein
MNNEQGSRGRQMVITVFLPKDAAEAGLDISADFARAVGGEPADELHIADNATLEQELTENWERRTFRLPVHAGAEKMVAAGFFMIRIEPR